MNTPEIDTAKIRAGLHRFGTASATLLDDAFALCDALDTARQEIADLRAGEDPNPAPPMVESTTGQWLHRFNNATPTQRHDVLNRLRDAAHRGSHCLTTDHDEQIVELREHISAHVTDNQTLTAQITAVQARIGDCAGHLHIAAEVERCPWCKIRAALDGAVLAPDGDLLGLQAEMDELERRDPAVAEAAASYDRMVEGVLDASPPRPDVHKPFTDDGITYCGWDKHEGCGEVWPCTTERAKALFLAAAMGEPAAQMHRSSLNPSPTPTGAMDTPATAVPTHPFVPFGREVSAPVDCCASKANGPACFRHASDPIHTTAPTEGGAE